MVQKFLVLNGMKLHKTAAKQLIKNTVLPSLSIGAVLIPGTPLFQTVYDLLSYHPDYKEKEGVGIKCFHVIEDPLFKNKRFDIERVDGSRIDFSYLACLKGKSDSHKEDVLKALRSAIREQIKEFKQIHFIGTDIAYCNLTNVPITFSQASVDHIPPQTFRSLVSQFLELEKIQFEDIEVIENEYKNSPILNMPELQEKWREFHKENAKLQLASLEANIKQGAGHGKR